MTSERAAQTVAAVVDDEGIGLPADVIEVVDVYFGERRIWSLNPLEFASDDDQMRSMPWPRVLKRRLCGRTRVSIRGHISQEVLFSRDVAFGNSTQSLQVVDDDGEWLTVTKWGSLAPAFAEVHVDDRQALVGAVARLLDTINAGTSLNAFAAYGTLLGAVRSGTLLSHDHDADIAYLSDADNPASLLRESFELQRFLRRQGWRLARKPNGFVAVALDLPSGRHAHVDVFSAHFAGDTLYLERWVSGSMQRREFLPLGHVELEGMRLAAPRSPEALLACTYGAGWVTPDPSFKYKVPRHVVSHFDRWVGQGIIKERRRWDRYHEAGAGSPTRRRTDFADWVLDRLPEGAAVVDLGCGSGHDAVRYAAFGHDVLGIDYATTAVSQARVRARAAQSSSVVTFQAFSVLDLRRLLLHGSRFAHQHRGPRAVTVRFLLDALSPELRRHVWWLCRTVLLGSGGSLFLEARVGDGAPSGHREGAPWVTQVDPDRVADEVVAHGGRVEESVDVPPQDGVTGTATARLRASWPAVT